MRTSMSAAVQFIVCLRIVGVPVGVAVRRSSGSKRSTAVHVVM
jgi:hypothetical protein